MNRTDRLLAIILLLRSRKKLSARKLAEIFEVSIRTIYRDIDSLCQANVPIAVELGPEGGYSLMETYSLPPVMFTPDEAVALFLGGSFIAHRQGTPFREAINTALIKIEDILPEELRKSVYIASQSILFDVKDRKNYSVASEVFQMINKAILERKCILMVYHSAREDRITERVVAPYGLIYDDGIWYLIGHCHLRGQERMFHVNRIKEISLTDRNFEVPKEFDLKSLADKGWAKSLAESMKRDYPRIRIKVTKEISEKLREDWLLRYANREETEDGKVILTYHDAVESHLYFMYRFGADCEVLEPKELRDQVVEQARKVLALYEGEEGTSKRENDR